MLCTRCQHSTPCTADVRHGSQRVGLCGAPSCNIRVMCRVCLTHTALECRAALLTCLLLCLACACCCNRSSSQLSVAAFHVHGAPPCVRSYARMYAVAQQYAASPAVQPAAAGTPSDGASPRVAFGVMDVDAVAAEGGAVSSKLGLQQLPAYIVYKDGEEVARLSSSPDRRRLAEVLAQQVVAVADAAAGSQQ